MTLFSLPVAALLHYLLLVPADQPHAQVQEVKQTALQAHRRVYGSCCNKAARIHALM
jgi:hypothetical protein